MPDMIACHACKSPSNHKKCLRLHKHRELKKILVIRFSSIGDIVLTTAVVRCLKNQIPGAEIHYCTKKLFAAVLIANPYIDKIHYLEGSLNNLAKILKKEKFDFVVDLHKSIRSVLLRSMLQKPSVSFPKLNFEKWLLVRFKINRLPERHVVDRFFLAVSSLSVINDGQGLDYFIPESDHFDPNWLPETHRKKYIGFVIGGRHQTKMFPPEKIIEVCRLLKEPVVLLGGHEDADKGEIIAKTAPGKIFNSCGKFTLNRSAALVKQAGVILTNDTGLMHIAAAFNKKIISLWGNTVPEFGMHPYMKKGSGQNSLIFEIKELNCRPCSKLGMESCPKKHFDCMNRLDAKQIAEAVHRMTEE
jgi:ADP-heptose:LPS heptosyltransferase